MTTMRGRKSQEQRGIRTVTLANGQTAEMIGPVADVEPESEPTNSERTAAFLRDVLSLVVTVLGLCVANIAIGVLWGIWASVLGIGLIIATVGLLIGMR